MTVVTVTVDSRPGESSLHASLTAIFEGSAVVALERAQMDLGDVRVVTASQTLVIERKTFQDLVSSILDGRWQEQKIRLLAERERREDFRFYYLIETENVPHYTAKTRNFVNQNAYAALINGTTEHDIPVHFVANTADAARHVERAAESLRRFVVQPKRCEGQGGYSKFVKHASKSANKAEEPAQVMLSAVAGVGGKRAHALLSTFGSVGHIVDALREGRDAQLADVKLNDRRLGPAVAGKLRKALL
jgi:ERCC4-type nuclease